MNSVQSLDKTVLNRRSVQNDLLETKSNISFDQSQFGKYDVNFNEDISDFQNYNSFMETERKSTMKKTEPNNRHRYFSIQDASQIAKKEKQEGDKGNKSYLEKELPEIAEKARIETIKTPLRREKILENFKTYSRRPSLDEDQPQFNTLSQLKNNNLVFSRTNLAQVIPLPRKEKSVINSRANSKLNSPKGEAKKNLEYDFYRDNKFKRPKDQSKNKKRSQIRKKLKELQERLREKKEDKEKRFREHFKRNYDYQSNIDQLRGYTKAQKYDQAIEMLEWIKNLEINERKIEAYKI